MARKKLKKFAENSARRNVVEPSKEIYERISGNWQSFFGNDRPVSLELACGRGEYTVGLAEALPEKNYVGVDLKGDRIWKGSKYAEENGLDNVAFLRCHIQNIENFIAPAEVHDIWIVFPDPRPKKRDIRRRLTNRRFMDIYKRILHPDGQVRLKTDDTRFFEFTLDLLKSDNGLAVKDLEYTRNLYESPLASDHFGIHTRYEKRWLAEGRIIKYLKFRFA